MFFMEVDLPSGMTKCATQNLDFLVYKGQRRLSNVVLPRNFLKLRLYLTINIRDGLLIPQILFICGPRLREEVSPSPPSYSSS